MGAKANRTNLRVTIFTKKKKKTYSNSVLFYLLFFILF
jgi:hypothetical protein